jgi:hypothetical protein
MMLEYTILMVSIVRLLHSSYLVVINQYCVMACPRRAFQQIDYLEGGLYQLVSY